jgi:hypothetical protein
MAGIRQNFPIFRRLPILTYARALILRGILKMPIFSARGEGAWLSAARTRLPTGYQQAYPQQSWKACAAETIIFLNALSTHGFLSFSKPRPQPTAAGGVIMAPRVRVSHD